MPHNAENTVINLLLCQAPSFNRDIQNHMLIYIWQY